MDSNRYSEEQEFQHKRWEELRNHILVKIDEIDNDTPASYPDQPEPKWWLEMMEVKRTTMIKIRRNDHEL